MILLLMGARAIRPRHFLGAIQATDFRTQMGDDMTREAIAFDMHQAALPKAVKRIHWTTSNAVVFFQV